jgi:uncharacterized Zn finger protein
METMNIKGSCESCGFAYEGTIALNDKSFPEIKCPKCGQVTNNFDDAVTVEENDRAEGEVRSYSHVEFPVIETAGDESHEEQI